MNDLNENGSNLLPYLKRQKWEKFVQIKELVYPDFVREFYENAYTSDTLKWINSSLGGKSLYLTQEIISEALDIPTTDQKVYGEDWISQLNTTKESVIRRVLKEGKQNIEAKNLQDHLRILHKMCPQSCS